MAKKEKRLYVFMVKNGQKDRKRGINIWTKTGLELFLENDEYIIANWLEIIKYEVITFPKSNKKEVLKFLEFAELNPKMQPEYRIDELNNRLSEKGVNIKSDKLKLILMDLNNNKLIEYTPYRVNAFRISDKGILYNHSSSWSRFSTNQKISIIGIIIGSILTIIGLFISYKLLYPTT
ncbi:MAG: hypothetical protein IIA45_06055 [Bacteroidetes bacterium]|nr:hypothetical protein [Bacteroidota bacterium]